VSTTCLIADDQAMVREGFRALLNAQTDISVVGQAADGAQAVRLSRDLRPDVVLMDVRMPVLDGLEATRQILGGRADEPKPRVLVLTTFDLDSYVYEALRAGASGFLLKDAPAAELVHAVRVVASGEALLAPSVTRRLIADFSRQQRADRPPQILAGRIDSLTPREAEIALPGQQNQAWSLGSVGSIRYNASEGFCPGGRRLGHGGRHAGRPGDVPRGRQPISAAPRPAARWSTPTPEPASMTPTTRRPTAPSSGSRAARAVPSRRGRSGHLIGAGRSPSRRRGPTAIPGYMRLAPEGDREGHWGVGLRFHC